jgi:hypothetical protein
MATWTSRGTAARALLLGAVLGARVASAERPWLGVEVDGPAECGPYNGTVCKPYVSWNVRYTTGINVPVEEWDANAKVSLESVQGFASSECAEALIRLTCAGYYPPCREVDAGGSKHLIAPNTCQKSCQHVWDKCRDFFELVSARGGRRHRRCVRSDHVMHTCYAAPYSIIRS